MCLSKFATAVVVLAVCLVAPTAALAATYTFSPNDRDLNDLPHGSYCVWSFDWSQRAAELPDGEVIDSASLVFKRMNDSANDPDNVLHIWLVDELPDVSWRTEDWPGLSVGRDSTDNTVDEFADSGGTFLMDYRDEGPDPENLVVNIPINVLNQYIANDDLFGLALDPDSHFSNKRVLLRIRTSIIQPMPEPLTAVGVFAGLAGLAGYLRRRGIGRRSQPKAAKQDKFG